MKIALGLLPITVLPVAMSDVGVEDVTWRVAERFGLWAALCLILIGVIVYLSWKRECRMAARIDYLESEFAKTSLVLSENGLLLKRFVEIQEQQLKELRVLSAELRFRPCLRERPRGEGGS